MIDDKLFLETLLKDNSFPHNNFRFNYDFYCRVLNCTKQELDSKLKTYEKKGLITPVN
jgi:hypothetical protein